MSNLKNFVERLIQGPDTAPELADAIVTMVTEGVCPSCKKRGAGEPEFDHFDTYMGIPARISDGCSHNFHKAWKVLNEAVAQAVEEE